VRGTRSKWAGSRNAVIAAIVVLVAVWCWGSNGSGELGDGTTGKGGPTEDRLVPVAVLGGIAFEEIVTGQLHVCGRTAAGEAWCWGAYPSGQLGNDARPDQVQPTRSAAGVTFTSLTASGTTTCGLTAEGVAWCWGNNTFGQLGNGAKTNAAVHVAGVVTGPTRFTSLSMGRAHTCGVDADGAAWCWGGNTYGQLGDGTKDERLIPTAVLGDHRFASLSAGTTHTCGVAKDGAAWCWGANSVGQLGDGVKSTAEDRTSPVAVAGGISFTAVSAGEDYTCGIAKDASAYCWGSSGVLGNGTRDPSTAPVRVRAV
jgi:alpha-tubulin suppressor-like RCC1 family protein